MRPGAQTQPWASEASVGPEQSGWLCVGGSGGDARCAQQRERAAPRVWVEQSGGLRAGVTRTGVARASVARTGVVRPLGVL